MEEECSNRIVKQVIEQYEKYWIHPRLTEAQQRSHQHPINDKDSGDGYGHVCSSDGKSSRQD